MKNFKQFMSESVNISGDFNGNLYMNPQDQQPQEEVGESYVADITWQNNIYRLEMVTKTGLPSKHELAEKLQSEYPGAMVHNVYPGEANTSRIKNFQRYQPERLSWSD